MTKLIDGDRLEAYLREESGADALFIQLILDDFEYRPPQKPMREIDIPAKEVVRRRDPGTSWEAAYSISSEKRQLLFDHIYFFLTTTGPKTDDEIRAYFIRHQIGHSPSGLRTRRAELVQAGWLRDSGNKRDSLSGHPATLWEALPELEPSK